MRGWLGPILFGLIVAAATAWAAVLYVPYGLMNVAMERLGQGGVNKMSYGNLATPERQPVVRPSPDLAYSSCPYDLSAGRWRLTWRRWRDGIVRSASSTRRPT
ncbi:hypothetical protein AN936_06465 [Sphingopyxis macrogoltabida]|uniref:DUF1254 domain-containing protein n=1 Tax=Sphingopyxis macrogoltabida TaxID=33050 RepID=A0A0N9UWG1_SPHMC|nr:hypothetical protein AN936_06465 [Sphingopyxis macrogoltabida]